MYWTLTIPDEIPRSAKGMDMKSLISEMETIVFSGTKLNIDYWIIDYFNQQLTPI